MLFKFTPPGGDESCTFFADWFLADPEVLGWSVDYSPAPCCSIIQDRLRRFSGGIPWCRPDCAKGAVVKNAQQIWVLTGETRQLPSGATYFEARWPD